MFVLRVWLGAGEQDRHRIVAAIGVMEGKDTSLIEQGYVPINTGMLGATGVMEVKIQAL